MTVETERTKDCSTTHCPAFSGAGQPVDNRYRLPASLNELMSNIAGSRTSRNRSSDHRIPGFTNFRRSFVRDGRIRAKVAVMSTGNHAAILFGVLLTAFVFLPSVARAQSCEMLQQELSRALGGAAAGDAAKAQRYDRALREQGAELARLRARARRAKCFGGGFLFFRSKPRPECRRIIPRLESMEANMAKLEQLRDRYSGGADRRRLSRIRSRMAQLGCATVYDDALLDNDGFFDESGIFFEWGDTVRTLCVRKCDGYYFPISFSTTQERFGADLYTCQAQCPAAEVDLYYHADPRGDAESLVSIGGEAYPDLPNAFRYRREYDPSCTCKSNATQFQSTTGEYQFDLDRISAAVGGQPPIPRPRYGPDEDPETSMNRLAQFVPNPVSRNRDANRISSIGGRTVRIVGPTYWGAPDKEEGQLIRAPGPDR